MPERSSRRFIHPGVGACGSMPSISRAAKRGQASGASTRTGRAPSNVTGTAAAAGSASGAPVTAATSRAMPAIDRQSARFGVIFSVISVSSSARASRSGVPGASDASSASRPEASSSMPSSRPEHSMPCDSTPRIAARRMTSPPGSVAPSRAQGASMPAAALGAPQTTVSAAASPTSTVHTRRRSAFGCGATASMRPTTTPANGGAAGRASSTSRPAIVRRSASSPLSTGGLHIVRSHCSENCMVPIR